MQANQLFEDNVCFYAVTDNAFSSQFIFSSTHVPASSPLLPSPPPPLSSFVVIRTDLGPRSKQGEPSHWTLFQAQALLSGSFQHRHNFVLKVVLFLKNKSTWFQWKSHFKTRLPRGLRIMVFYARPDDLNLILRTHMVERENQLINCSGTFTVMLWHVEHHLCVLPPPSK